MKKIFQLALVLLAFLPLAGFAQEEKNVWPEMKAFHTLIAASFHPAEEGNLAPVKEKAESLYQAARTWRESEVPAGFKKEETQNALKKLEIKCGELHKAVVAQASDDRIKALITEAHDAFHTIVERCRREQ